MERPLVATFAIVLVLTIAAWVSGGVLSGEPKEWIRISRSMPTYALEDLAKASEAIAVVEFKSTNRMFWNNRSNSRWEPEIASGALALIYRDDAFTVVDTLKGKLPDTLVVRGVGGQVGNVRMDYEGQLDWVKGGRYLLFLRQDDTPFENYTERVWTVVWTGSGSFAPSAGRWVNADRILDLGADDVVTLRD